jgi:hypothetical protein
MYTLKVSIRAVDGGSAYVICRTGQRVGVNPKKLDQLCTTIEYLTPRGQWVTQADCLLGANGVFFKDTVGIHSALKATYLKGGHPECEHDEEVVTNTEHCDPGLLPGAQLGEIAYDIYGNVVVGMKPVIVQKQVLADHCIRLLSPARVQANQELFSQRTYTTAPKAASPFRWETPKHNN